MRIVTKNNLWILSDGTVLPNDVRKCKGTQLNIDSSDFMSEHSMTSIKEAYEEYRNEY